MSIGPDFAQYGYWGVAVAGVAAITPIAKVLRRDRWQLIFSLACVLAIVAFSAYAAVELQISEQNLSEIQKNNAIELDRYKSQVEALTVQSGKTIPIIVKQLDDSIQLARGAATNTSDAATCTKHAYNLATQLIAINNELRKLAK